MKRYFPVLRYVNVPNAITTAGLFFGILACYYLMQGMLRNTIVCLFIATLMDLADGFSAAKLNQRTRFGEYMDALVDYFTCCVIPVLMLYRFAGGGVIIFAASAFYAVCGLWRLAYFITVTAGEKQPYFTGLPVPGAMFVSVASVWLAVVHGVSAWFCAAVFVMMGLLMVSSLRIKKYGVSQKLFWATWLVFLAVIALL